MTIPNINNPITLSALFPINNATYKLFETMLGVLAPFYIYNLTLDAKNFVFNIFITTHKKNVFTSPCCNIPDCKIHSKHPRTIRTLDIFNYQAFLHYDKPLVKCPNCGKISAISLPWETPNSTLTSIFEDKVIALAENMPFTTVAKMMSITDKRAAHIINRRVSASRESLDLSNTTKIGLDETSEAKGHNYISVFLDMDDKKVIFATPGKDSSVVKTFTTELEKKNGHPDNIQEVTMDMSPAFILSG